MGLQDIDKSGEFADTRSDQREHKPMDVFGMNAHRAIGYMEGALTDIERICQRQYRTKAEMEGAMAAALGLARSALKKAASV